MDQPDGPVGHLPALPPRLSEALSTRVSLPYRRTTRSRSSVERLGFALAAGDPLSDQQEAEYRDFIEDAESREIIVRTTLDSLLPRCAADLLPNANVVAASRTKTRATIVEKLRRNPSGKLTTISDIAGVRVVADMTLLEQRMLALDLQRRLDTDDLLRETVGFSGQTRILDRLTATSHGYRAIHLITRLDSQPVEIQLRTMLQHEWAALMELACDRWGREPRYGLPLREPDPEVAALKASFMTTMQQWSETIAAFEARAAPQGLRDIKIDVPGILAGAGDQGVEVQRIADVFARIIRDADATKVTIAAEKEAMQQSLAELAATVDAIDSATDRSS